MMIPVFSRVMQVIAALLLRSVIGILPAPRRDWGRATIAELEAFESARERLGFAMSGALGICRITVGDALRGRLADPGVVLAAILLGALASIVDLAADGRASLWVLFGGGSLCLGLLHPGAAWRWGLLAALMLPVFVQFGDAAGPYAHDPADVWFPLLPSMMLAVLGGLIRTLAQRLRHSAKLQTHDGARS